MLSNSTSKYGDNFSERCRKWDAANPTGPEPITLAGFVAGAPGIFAIDPQTGKRHGERIVQDAEKKYGLRHGFSP
jgi:hypothetical protein